MLQTKTESASTLGAGAGVLAVLIPVYNESEGIAATLIELLEVLGGLSQFQRISLVLVDDGSTDGTLASAYQGWKASTSASRVSFQVLSMDQNGGHQAALAAGLRYVERSLSPTACLVMDGDGQDDPAALPDLLAKLGNRAIVFARRTKRAESLGWRFGYWCYQTIFRTLLGKRLYFGNFCAFTAPVLKYLNRQRDVDHLAACLSLSTFSKEEVGVPRRSRTHGESKMNVGQLVDYGVAAMTWSSEAWVRLFTRVGVLFAVSSVLSVLVVIGIRTFTSFAIPGWSSIVVLNLVSLMFQALGFLVMTATVGRVLKYSRPAVASGFTLRQFEARQDAAEMDAEQTCPLSTEKLKYEASYDL